MVLRGVLPIAIALAAMPAAAQEAAKLVSWYTADLRQRLELATRYVCGLLDADRDEEPFFHITRREDGTAFAGHALEIGIPHVTGRAIDALFFTEEVLGRPVPAHAEKVYTRYLLSCYDNEDHLPSFYDPAHDNARGVEFHNCREGLEGLTWLIKRRDDATARAYAHAMLRTLDRITDRGPDGGQGEAAAGGKAVTEVRSGEGRLSPALVRAIGREGAFLGIGDVQTVAAGRLVGPLCRYYRLAGDPLALDLAGRYARYVMRTAFTPEGLLTDLAGNHVHSITSTLSGVLEYAVMVGDGGLVDAVRRAYEVGLRELYSTYGWCKEQAWLETDQGECNQTGDLIQIQLLLASVRDPAYYAQAETFLRSGLLPAQVLDASFCHDNAEPGGDFERDMLSRMIGGFGFPTPSSHLQTAHSPINTVDITQGAVQAICEATKHIITEDGLGVRVNLLFGWENDLAKVESGLPAEGRVAVTVKRPRNLLVRLPARIDAASLCVTKDGEPAEVGRLGVYLLVPNDRAGAQVAVTFSSEPRDAGEYVYHKLYQVRWFGEQVLGVEPVQGLYPLFGEWPE